MKRERKHIEGEYQIWSGVTSPTGKGVFVVYWKGLEIGREAYWHRASHVMCTHQSQQSTKPRPKRKDTETTKEIEAWLGRLL